MELTTHPISIGGTDLLALQKAFTLGFGYGAASPLQYRHGFENGKTSFTVTYDGELPPALIPQASRLHRIEVDGRPVYYFNAIISADGITENQSPAAVASITKDIQQQRQWHTTLPLQNIPMQQTVTANASPQAITLPEIATKVAGKRYYFFTGAGLSASVVPDWNGLMGLMGYKQGRADTENLADTLGAINNRLPEIMHGLDAAHRSFVNGAPTAGHRALAGMSTLLRRPVLTDNRDLIQQAAGTQAIHVNQLTPFSGAFQPPIACDPKAIDGVIVCGMGGDRRGFIQWLKENNPQAEIIHMDLAPSATVHAERFIQGDAQILLPELQKQVAAYVNHTAQASRPSFAQKVRT